MLFFFFFTFYSYQKILSNSIWFFLLLLLLHLRKGFSKRIIRFLQIHTRFNVNGEWKKDRQTPYIPFYFCFRWRIRKKKKTDSLFIFSTLLLPFIILYFLYIIFKHIILYYPISFPSFSLLKLFLWLLEHLIYLSHLPRLSSSSVAFFLFLSLSL